MDDRGRGINAGGRLPERGTKRLRFESEAGGGAIEGITSGQLGPKSTPGLSQKDRYKRRVLYEHKAPPHGIPPTDNPQAPG